MEIRFYGDPENREAAHYCHNVSKEEVEDELSASRWRSTAAEETKVKENKFPPGRDEERFRRVLAHYEEQTEAEAAAEDEAAFEDRNAIREIAEDEKRQEAIRAVGLRNAERRADEARRLSPFGACSFVGTSRRGLSRNRRSSAAR